MIRVYDHPDRISGAETEAYEDYDATSAAVAGNGALVLARVEFHEVRDPHNLAAPPRVERSEAQMVEIIADGLWGRVVNLDLSSDG